MKFFEVTYYIDRLPHDFGFAFESADAAIYTARSILERHGLAADVMDCETGEIIAIFEPNNTYIDERYLQDGAIIEMR